MSRPRNDESTAGFTGTRPTPAAGAEGRVRISIPALTLLYHPDLRRVGERVLLSELRSGLAVELERNRPELAPPGGSRGEPLADRFLSRRPLRFQPADGDAVALEVGASRTRVAVDGEPLAGERTFTAGELERGVVLELAGRVVVLLHAFAPPPVEEAERFGLVGDSAAMARVRNDVRRVADLDIPVLVRGETGTGKELVARAIHDAGPRRERPFLAVNLGAVPPSLAASELFGAARGAFTGAVRAQDGYFRRARGGTLFLDEVGEAPAEVQVSLLRALETGEVFPVGAQTPQRVDARLLAATDAALEQREGFRAPLLHRLASYEIHLPPLRRRRDDVGRLLLSFLRRELERVGEADRFAASDATTWLPPSLVARLARHDWPGNVRQLRNVARQLAVANRGLPAFELDGRLERLLSDAAGPAAATAGPGRGAPDRQAARAVGGRRKPAEVAEGELLAALREHRWDLTAAAAALRLSRSSLYARIAESPRVRTAGDLTVEEIERGHRDCGGDLEAMVDRLEVSKHALKRRLRELGLG